MFRPRFRLCESVQTKKNKKNCVNLQRDQCICLFGVEADKDRMQIIWIYYTSIQKIIDVNPNAH